MSFRGAKCQFEPRHWHRTICLANRVQVRAPRTRSSKGFLSDLSVLRGEKTRLIRFSDSLLGGIPRKASPEGAPPRIGHHSRRERRLEQMVLLRDFPQFTYPITGKDLSISPIFSLRPRRSIDVFLSKSPEHVVTLRVLCATGRRGQDFPPFPFKSFQPLAGTTEVPFIIRPVEALSLAVPELDE